MAPACLQCGIELLEPYEECHACGLVQAKHRPAEPVRGGLRGGASDAGGRSAIVAGTVVAVVVYLVPFTRFVFSYLTILVHELGHAAASWALAMPAVPSLDFVYGGGVTLHGDLSLLLAVALGALWVWWILALRSRPRECLLVAAAAGVWVAVLLSPLREVVVVAMGHGAELLLASVFYYRALSGRSVRTPAERPAYAFAAGFLTLSSVHFGGQLLRSAWFRRQYEGAKGGHRMDFTRLAEDFLDVDLQWVAAAFFVLSFSPPLVAWLWHRNRP